MPPEPARTRLTALLTLAEVAEVSRSPISTVRHWIATGALDSVRPGRRRLVRRAVLARFLETPVEELTQ